ncbi:MAG: hypothetical protein ABSA68_02540 [Xanthobacteraceae bacterium]
MAIYAGLVALAFSINYPGRLTPDSLDMLTQAVHPEALNDWHEPATTEFWLIFAPILGQPASALLSQALLIFFYPAILIERTIAQRLITVPLLLGLTAFVAALVAVTGIISKDIVLVGLVFCLLAVLDFHSASALGVFRSVLFAGLIIAIALIRPTNSLIIGATGVYWVVIRRIKVLVAIPVLILICIATVASPWMMKHFDQTLLGAADARAEDSLVIFDVAGISSAIHKDLFADLPGWLTDRPSDPNSKFSVPWCNTCASGACLESFSSVCRTAAESGDQLKRKVQQPWHCYTPIGWDPFAWGECKEYLQLFRDSNVNPIYWWLRTIVDHPIGYAIHRLKYAFHLVRSMRPISTRGTPYATNVTFRLNELFGPSTEGFDMRNRFQLWENRIALVPFEWTAAFVFSRPTLVIVIFVCLLVLINGWQVSRARGEIDPVEVTAGAIGLANVLMLVAFGVSAEGRYLLLTFVCGFVIMLRRLIGYRASWRHEPELAG